jgi:hypothetical protein
MQNISEMKKKTRLEFDEISEQIVQKVLRFPVEFRKEKLLLAACGTAP